MSSEDIVLIWRFPPDEEGKDMRTFDVLLDLGGALEAMHLYKFLTIPGVAESATTFERWNLTARRWEVAGEIGWVNNLSGRVQFGFNTVQIHELRKRKKQSSRSRRFSIDNVEYKWKVSASGSEMFCVDAQGQIVATWNQEESRLRVAANAEDILDRLVVTCLIHLWFRANGFW